MVLLVLLFFWEVAGKAEGSSNEPKPEGHKNKSQDN